MKKSAFYVQMHFEVPDSEKKMAALAQQWFEYLIAVMDETAIYLSAMHSSFKDIENPDHRLIIEYRDVFRKYRDQLLKKFQKISDAINTSVKIMKEFSVDESTEDIMISFRGYTDELLKYMDVFVSIFDDINDERFINHMIATIDSLKKQFNKVERFLLDRVLEHINQNILSDTWHTEDDKDRKLPLVVKLFKERQKALKDIDRS
jgi:hypothetical protein